MKKHLLFGVACLLLLLPFALEAQIDCSTSTNFDPGVCYTSSSLNEIQADICPDDPASSVMLTFTAGEVENSWDELVVYEGASGSGSGGTQIYSGYGTGGDLTGLTVEGTTPGACLSVYIDADGSTDCVSEGYATPVFDATCTVCMLPANRPMTGTTLSLGGACLDGDNTGAGEEADEPVGTCFSGGTQNSVWYQVAGDGSDITVTTDFIGGSNGDTEIAIYTFDDPTSYCGVTQVACDQDGGIDEQFNSIATFTSTAATTYYVQLSGYNGTEGTYQIQAYSTASPRCEITSVTGVENGDCDSGTETYSADVSITTASAVSSGNFTVNGQTFPADGSNPLVVTLVGLTADGVGVDLDVTYDLDPCCTGSALAAFTAPTCSATCTVNSISSSNLSACTYDSGSGMSTYSVDIEVVYSTPPAGGTLDITIDGNTTSEAITSSPQTISLIGLTADGMDKDVTAAFSMDGACTLTETALYTAPEDCSPPANDLCSGAIPLVCNDPALAGTTVNTTELASPNGCASSYGVWYSYVSDGSIITITSSASFDHEIEIVSTDSDCDGTFTNEGCRDFSTGTESISLATTSGVTYYIYIAHYSVTSTVTGTIDIELTCVAPPDPPANDLCTTATDVSSMVGTGTCGADITGTNNGATDSGEAEPSCATGNYSGGDIWYQIDVPAGETILNYTRSASAFSTTYAILYSGSCAGLTEEYCSTLADDSWEVIENTTYYLRLFDWGNNDFGDVTFCLEYPCRVDDIVHISSTPCATNLYNATFEVTLANATGVSMITVTVDGISETVTYTGGTTTVTVSGLTSDGAQETAVVTTDAGCEPLTKDTHLAEAACDCLISDVTVGADMNCSGSTYDRTLTITYDNAPVGGTLEIVGASTGDQSLPITGSPQIVPLNALPADGTTENISISFSMEPTCSNTASFANLGGCPPDNDLVANATDLTAQINAGEYMTGDNNEYATDGANPFTNTSCNSFDAWCNANPAYRDLWYSVTPTVTGCFGFLSVSTAGSSFDTKIAIYDNDMTTVISGNDDYHGFGGGYASLTTAAVTAGNTYYIQVAGYGSTSFGDITLDIVFSDITESTANGEGNKTADFECTGVDGWTHYVNTTDGEVLLSIEKNGENLGWVPMTSTSCELEAGSTALDVGTGGCGAFYATAAEWVIMNRTWDFTPSSQPAAPVNIRFYYANADLNDINAVLSAPISHATMVHYKITSGEENLISNPCHADDNAGTAAYEEITTFVNGMCGSYTYAEYAVSSFSGGGGGGGPTGSALPIQLDRFSAKEDGRHNMIEWSTLSEINVQDHTLMKSKDAQNWEVLGITEGEINSSSIIDYKMIDALPYNMTYYQLMTTDIDGTVAYSPIVSVARDTDEASAFLGASPVPTLDVVNLNVYSQTDDNLTITLTDISGKRVMVNNKTITQGNHQIPLDLSNMTNGVYLVTITSDFISQTVRVIKN